MFGEIIIVGAFIWIIGLAYNQRSSYTIDSMITRMCMISIWSWMWCKKCISKCTARTDWTLCNHWDAIHPWSSKQNFENHFHNFDLETKWTLLPFLTHAMPMHRQSLTGHMICHIDYNSITFANIYRLSRQLLIHCHYDTFNAITWYTTALAAIFQRSIHTITAPTEMVNKLRCNLLKLFNLELTISFYLFIVS